MVLSRLVVGQRRALVADLEAVLGEQVRETPRAGGDVAVGEAQVGLDDALALCGHGVGHLREQVSQVDLHVASRVEFEREASGRSVHSDESGSADSLPSRQPPSDR